MEEKVSKSYSVLGFRMPEAKAKRLLKSFLLPILLVSVQCFFSNRTAHLKTLDNKCNYKMISSRTKANRNPQNVFI